MSITTLINIIPPECGYEFFTAPTVFFKLRLAKLFQFVIKHFVEVNTIVSEIMVPRAEIAPAAVFFAQLPPRTSIDVVEVDVIWRFADKTDALIGNDRFAHVGRLAPHSRLI
jgi:hypothetical protein